jgi:putative DNA primase/helicase
LGLFPDIDAAGDDEAERNRIIEEHMKELAEAQQEDIRKLDQRWGFNPNGGTDPSDPKSTIHQAVEDISNKFRFATFEETDEILYYESGVDNYGGEVLVRKYLERRFGEKATIHLCREILDHVRRLTYHKRSEFDADVNIINLRNGLYHVLEDRLDGHTPDHLSLNQKPIVYNPKSKPKVFGKFLSEILYPADIRTLVELMAYSFYRKNFLEKITYLHGFGGNGKTVVFRLLTRIHGDENVGHVSMRTILERPFGLYELVDKDLNLDSELSSKIIEDSAILKKITGQERTYVEQKNQKGFYATLHAKSWFSCNLVPQILNATDADHRRNTFIEFPNTFEGKNEDPHYIDKLTTDEELSGIFNVLMVALRCILRTQRIYENQKTMAERRRKYELLTNPIAVFIEEAFEPGSLSDDYTRRDTCYNAYSLFCINHNIAATTIESLGRTLKSGWHWEQVQRQFVMARGEKKRIWCWEGHKLTEFYLRALNLIEQETLFNKEEYDIA